MNLNFDYFFKKLRKSQTKKRPDGYRTGELEIQGNVPVKRSVRVIDFEIGQAIAQRNCHLPLIIEGY